MMSSFSATDILSPFHGRLTAEEVAVIEEEMDRLLVDMFISNEATFHNTYEVLENDLQLPLADKIRGYLEVVTQIEQNAEEEPELQVDPRFGDHLRALLPLVENYYHMLN